MKKIMCCLLLMVLVFSLLGCGDESGRLRRRIADLENTIGQQEERISGLENETEQLDGKIAGLESEKEYLEERIAGLEKVNGQLKDIIEEMEDKLEDDFSLPEPLDAEIENRIKQDYFNENEWGAEWQNFTMDDIIIYYYGTHKGYVAVLLFFKVPGRPQAETLSETIGGVFIQCPLANKIRLWKDGSFCYLGYAYNQGKGLLTQRDLRKIAYYTKTIEDIYIDYYGPRP